MPLCCVSPERSCSPVPPVRRIDPIFTVTALPGDHPHSVEVERPPPVDQTLVRSPSIVSKLKSHLHRKSTVKSLKSQLYDGDHGVLTSEEVLVHVESDRQHGRSPSSSYSTEDMLAICKVFDGSVDDVEKRTESAELAASQGPATEVQQLSLSTDTRLSIGRASLSRTAPFAEITRPSISQTASANPLVTEPRKLTPGGESLADYERKLSVCGDDRRWDAACNVQKYAEVQDDDKANIGLLARLRPSRATSRASNTLMEDALERQLQEKVLFKSPSKAEIETPSFLTTTWTGSSHQDEEALDPLDVGQTRMRREAPDSWCRWPSYDRGSRAGSAGIEDDVLVRDFAKPQAYADRGQLSNPAVSELKIVKRYYTDLFTTTGFHGKGHRTSIWGSGKLRDPDIELLPPSLPACDNEDPPDWVEGRHCLLPGPEPQLSKGNTKDDGDCAPGEQCGDIDVLSTNDQSLGGGLPLDTRRSSAPVLPVQSDGAGDMTADQLSAMYSDCVSRPFSPVRVTRYPSATVIDDRKGHWRSISLVSEKSLLRESSYDLLQLIEREKEKCERLIMG